MDADQSTYRQHGLCGAGQSLYSCALALQVAVLVALAVRIASRKMSKAGIGADDWFIIISVTFDVIMTSVTIADVYFGYGTPATELSPSDEFTVLLLFWVFQIVYKIVIGCCKLSFCLFFSRIIPPGNGTLRYCNLAIMSVVISYSIASVIATIAQCNPVPKAWDRTCDGTCINTTAFWFFGAVYSILTDSCIVALPCILCLKLKLSKREKAGLILIFCVGFFVVGTSIGRVTTLDVSSKSVDPSSGTFSSTRWTVIEANTMIMVACFPSFKQPVKWVYRHYSPLNGSKQTKSDPLHGSTAYEGWRASTMDLRDIAVTTDVNVEYEEKSRASSSFMSAPRQEAMLRAHELT